MREGFMFHRRKSDHIGMAITVHDHWVQDLRWAIESNTPVKPSAELADDRGCALGAWLHGPELDAATRATPAWQVIARLHRELHQSASTAVRLYEQGRRADAAALLARETVPQSDHLVAGLEKWRAEVAFGPRR